MSEVVTTQVPQTQQNSGSNAAGQQGGSGKGSGSGDSIESRHRTIPILRSKELSSRRK